MRGVASPIHTQHSQQTLQRDPLPPLQLDLGDIELPPFAAGLALAILVREEVHVHVPVERFLAVGEDARDGDVGG